MRVTSRMGLILIVLPGRVRYRDQGGLAAFARIAIAREQSSTKARCLFNPRPRAGPHHHNNKMELGT